VVGRSRWKRLTVAELAAEAGLQVDNGILVDERLSTSDPTILAIGDCAAWPTRFAGGRVRLESVQNAVEQARFVASRIAGAHSAPYDAVPWFWSDQGREFKLQIAGITSRCDAVATRGVIEDGSFSAFCFREGRFIGAESVNRPVDHMNARRLLALGAPLRPEEAADEEFDFRIYAELATGRTSLPNKDRGW
jgi:3-phenylpropionate/trans-cinnamate dioxygenase ferredoxin reductase subunit